MPTSHRRFSVIVPPDLEEVLTADAKANDRAVANQIIWIARRYYQDRRNEAEVINLTRTGEADRRKEVVFRTQKNPQAVVES
jgi:hypothetical protein